MVTTVENVVVLLIVYCKHITIFVMIIIGLLTIDPSTGILSATGCYLLHTYDSFIILHALLLLLMS